MAKPLLPEIIEATRLTRAGRLSEATALLQKSLGANQQRQPQAEPSARSIAPPVIDLVAEDLTPGGADAQRARPDQAQAAANQSRRGGNTTARPTPGNKRPLRRTLAGVLGALDPLVRAKGPAVARKRPAPPQQDIFPSVGSFVARSFSNEAGTLNYRLYIPSQHKGEPRPLILMLHGCTQSPEDFAAGTRMNFAAEEHACFVAYPEQTAAANSAKCWNWFHSGHQGRDRGEPSLIAGIARQVMGEHNIDRARIYIAGLSAGGAASAVVAEAYPDVFAALGVHSGLACGAARDLPSAFAAMQGRHAGSAPSAGAPIPTIVFHGDCDNTVHPKNGVQVVTRAAGGEKLERVVEHGRSTGGRSFTRSVHRGPAGNTLIEDWVVHGAGHAWSGGSPAGSFTDPLGPDATTHMLGFFLEQKLGR
jgi:poly(hydroxyalkanoate) depolymerase family esterase